MKCKRLLLALVLLVAAGSMNVVHASKQLYGGNTKEFQWAVFDDGELVISMHKDANIPDYDIDNKAPWRPYWEEISHITIDQTLGNVQRFGKECFRGLEVDSIRYRKGNNYSTLPNMYTIGYCAFNDFNTHFLGINFNDDASRSQKEIGRGTLNNASDLVYIKGALTLNEYSVAGTHYMVRLSSSTKLLKAGSLCSPSLWHDNGVPSVIFDGSTPPEWERLYDQGNSKADEWFSSVAFVIGTLGLAGFVHWSQGESVHDYLYPTREYEYPFGDCPHPRTEIICVVPPSAVETYKTSYRNVHPEVGDEGHMCAYYMGEHEKVSWTAPCGRVVGGRAIEHNGNYLYGWWYVDGDALHVGWNGHDMLYYGRGHEPWDGHTEGVKKVYIHDTPKIPTSGVSGGSNPLFDFEEIYVDEHLKHIEYGAFEFGKLKYIYVMNPADKTEVEAEDMAFAYCSNLKTISSNIVFKKIGKSCFEECKNLTNVNLSDWMLGKNGNQNAVIPDFAFYNCEQLPSVDLQGISEVGKKAFMNTGITNVNMNRGATIGENAFSNCKYLHKITFTGSYKELKNGAFSGCTGINDIFVGDYKWYDNPIADLDMWTFGNDVKVEDITLHVDAGLYYIYEHAPIWEKMKVDKEFVWPVKGDFNNRYMHWELSANGTLTIEPISPNGNYSQYENFYHIPDYNSVESTPWYQYREYVRSIMLKSAVGNNGKAYGVTKIGKNAFNFDGIESQLTDVHIPRTCKEIHERAFYGNKNLVGIYIDDVEQIGDYAFAECSNLVRIDLGAGLKQAGNYIFRHCSKLNKIDVSTIDPAAVSKYTFAEIGNNQNNGPRRSPAAVAATDGQQNVTLNVPDGALNNYLTANYWNQFHFNKYDERYGSVVTAGKFGSEGMWILWSNGTMTISANKDLAYNENPNFGDYAKQVKEIIIEGELTSLGKEYYALFHSDMSSWSNRSGFINLERVVLPYTLKQIGDNTFENCTKLRDINLTMVETIGASAFSCCGLTSASLATLKSVGNYAFEKNVDIKTVAIGDEATELGRDIFRGCKGLELVNLGGGKLGVEMFIDCINLQSASYDGSELPSGVFNGCSSLSIVTLGSQLGKIGTAAFAGCSSLDTIYISTPTAPEMEVYEEVRDYQIVDDDMMSYSKTVSDPFGTQIIGLYDGGKVRWSTRIDHKKIVVSVPDLYEKSYRKADIWKEMRINDREGLEFPITFEIGDGTYGEVTENGDLTIRTLGEMKGDANAAIGAWSEYIEGDITFTYPTKSVMGAFAAEDGVFASLTQSPQSVTFGALMEKIGDYAFYNEVFNPDVQFYCYAPLAPSLANNAFNWATLNPDGWKPTLHVIGLDEVLEDYRMSLWGEHFELLGDLSEQEPPTSYTVTFVDGVTGEEIATRTVPMGKSTFTPQVPEHIGYRFIEWDGTFSNVWKNETVTATYAEASCNVYFMVDETVYSSQEVPLGGDAERPAVDPVKDGYIFYNWKGSYQKVTGDIVITALFTQGTPVEEVIINPETHSEEVGKSELGKKTFQMDATIEPFDAFIQTVAWMSYNKKIATVNQSGLVTIQGFGECIIRVMAKDGTGNFADCKLVVTEKEEEGIENIEVNDTNRKIILDGQLYILRNDGAIFNATGVRVK